MSTEVDSFSILRDRAYELAVVQLEPRESVAARLIEEGASRILAEAAVEAALDLRHERALRGELSWDSFVAALARRPAESGVEVMILTAATAVVAFLGVKWGAVLFPRGIYPTFVLALPGLIAGLVFFGLGTIPVYWLKKNRTRGSREKWARNSADHR